MAIFFSSDFHLGHKVIVPKYRDFSSQAEHDSLILDQIASLSKRDILFILGDFIFDSANYEQYMSAINKMSCRIKLVMGNHDSKRLYSEPKLEIQLPLFSYKGDWVSHCPIHPQELRNRPLQIHGHLHGDTIDDPRYFNVNLDNHQHKLVPYEQIKAYREALDIPPCSHIR